MIPLMISDNAHRELHSLSYVLDAAVGSRNSVAQHTLLLIIITAASCACRKDTSADAGDSATEVDPCEDLLEMEGPRVFRTSGDTPNYETTQINTDYMCQLGEDCVDSFIIPKSIYQFTDPPNDSFAPSDLLFVAADGTTIRSEVVRTFVLHSRVFEDSDTLFAVSEPIDSLAPSSSYAVWRTTESELCYDFTLTTSSHGSPISPPALPPPVMQIDVDNLHYLFDPWRIFWNLFSGTAGGPNFAIQFGVITDGAASVRIAAANDYEQSWCHATVDTVVTVDDHGAFQILGVPWRGTGNPSKYGDFRNLLVAPFTISGHLAPDGQNAIVTLDDVLLDERLYAGECDPTDKYSFFLSQCPDGEICCMDMSTGPTITEPSPLTSIEYIAQDNCHPRCPTSADNPDCTLP